MASRNLLSLAILLSSVYTVYAQGFGLGLNPSNMKWRQIDTDKVQVIYPEGLDDRAQRAANIIHVLYDSSYYPLGDKDDKISVIVQNQTTISNGFVSPFGPIRTEFFTTPPQFGFLGGVDWWDALTIHEYRHVEQVYNARRGVSKISSVIFGENGLGGAAGLAMPRWFFEGDATFYETQLTSGGRGRTPDFDKQYRALMLDNRIYGYEKASAFSLRDFVPNHYAQGYYMTTHVRRKYGDQALTNAAQEATAYKGIIYPFSKGLKRNTGKNARELYEETFEELKEEWETESQQLDLTPSMAINDPAGKRAFTSYQLPVFISENELIVEKRGFQDIRQFVLMDMAGNEKKIITPGMNATINSIHAVAGNSIVWSELTYDERWGNQDFSILKRMDLDSKVPKRLTNRSKYFAPDLSSDGNKIVTVQVGSDTKYSLHILDASTGTILRQLPNPENYFFAFPKWRSENEIIAVAQKNSKNTIVSIDAESGIVRSLTEPTYNQITYPRPFGDWIFFTNTISGIDNIHVYDLQRGEEFQVTSTLLGATQAAISPSGQQLVFSEFTADGWDLKRMDVDPSSWRPLQDSYVSEIDFYQPTTKYPSILESVPSEEFPTKKFRKTNGLINLHSWSPIAIQPDYGGMVQFGNTFSTLTAQGSYQFNVNEETASWSASAIYAELYPVFTAGYRRGDRDRPTRFYREVFQNTDTLATFGTRSVDWKEDDISVGVLLPLNLTNGNHFGSLDLTAEYHELQVEFDDPSEGTDGSFNAIEMTMDFSRFQSTARQQVLPRWGQIITFDYLSTLNAVVNESEYAQVTGQLFFPGFHKTHGTALRGAFRQENSESSYKFRDRFPYARGYGSSLSDEIWVVGVQYGFPIWLPDVALGPFAFVKRIKGTAFFDYSQSTLNPIQVRDLTPLSDVNFRGIFPEIKQDFRSVGFDLRLDIRFFRLLEVDAGVRYAYLIDDVGLERHRFLPIVASIGF